MIEQLSSHFCPSDFIVHSICDCGSKIAIFSTKQSFINGYTLVSLPIIGILFKKTKRNRAIIIQINVTLNRNSTSLNQRNNII